MRRILTIAWKEIYLTFTDRSQLMLMILTPLVISTIIGLAFSGAGGAGISIEQIPLAVVNLDEGAEANGQTFQFGEIFTGLLLPATEDTGTDMADQGSCELVDEQDEQAASAGSGAAPGEAMALTDLFAAEQVADPETARAGVEEGTYRAALIIPADFSRRLVTDIDGQPAADTDDTEDTAAGGAMVEVYANRGAPVSGTIVRSVAQSITSQFATGSVAIAATIDTLVQRAQEDPSFGLSFLAANVTGGFQPNFACAFTASLGTVSVDAVSLSPVSGFVGLLVNFGAAQSVFFATFTALFGLLTIYEERKQGTLQRLIIAPMPRVNIVVGKLAGSYLSVFLQIVLLLLSLTVIASVVEGSAQFIWGSNLPLLLLLIVAVTLSVAGIGAFIVGLARTPEQAQGIGTLINVVIAMLGGTFGFQLPATVAQFSPIYWAVEGFNRLAGGDPAIGLPLLVLVVQGGVMFLIGAWFFSRRSME